MAATNEELERQVGDLRSRLDEMDRKRAAGWSTWVESLRGFLRANPILLHTLNAAATSVLTWLATFSATRPAEPAEMQVQVPAGYELVRKADKADKADSEKKDHPKEPAKSGPAVRKADDEKK